MVLVTNVLCHPMTGEYVGSGIDGYRLYITYGELLQPMGEFCLHFRRENKVPIP